MTRENKAKKNAIRFAQERKRRELELVAKAIRRHYGKPHGFEAWGQKYSMLRAIHAEIEPKLKLIRAAEHFTSRKIRNRFIPNALAEQA